jgi:Conjugal transfer protein TraD
MTEAQARKARTFHLIKLGGLVVKGGLGDMPSNVILGAVVDAKRRCDAPREIARLSALGDETFGTDRRE